MFSVTTKAHYGVAAILELAQNYGQGLVQIKDIVKRRKIPKNYLEQIFNRLGKQAIVRAVRGNNGGYELCDDPSKISLLKILEALEGEIDLKSSNGIEAMQELYGSIEREAKRILDIPLSELLVRQQRHNQQVMFHI